MTNSEKVCSENTKAVHNTYVYYNDGSGYAKEVSACYPITGKQVKIVLSKDALKDVKEVRIDPVDGASVIKMIRLEVETAACFRKILLEEADTNGKVLPQGLLVFTGEAPQIVITVPKDEKWLGMVIEFEVLSDDISALAPVFAAYEQESIEKAKEYEEQCQMLWNAYQNKSQPVSGQEQLMRDKLAYIQSTTVYRKLLKSKVDGMGLWNGLDI